LNSTEKRIIDIIGAIFGLLLGLPFFLIAMLIVKFIDRVPIIFHQERFGLHGKPFNFFKLRTLKVIDERRALQIERIQYKPQYETTPTGKFWRRTSIDEIIQFWLVLKGEMSLIGHRPLPIYYIDYLDQIDGMNKPKLKHYLKVISHFKPGMSSLSAVNGRGDLTMQQKMEYDLIYAQKANIVYDLALLLRTIVVVITQRGAK
jgi:lipopolysaccharide/colanic/teichoic acid biosynthesis glycosyltransferase